MSVAKQSAAAESSPACRDEILEQAITWLEQGHAVALGTVIETWGASPRPPGSQMAVNDRGAFVGSVSGGCLETVVVSEALDVIAEGRPLVLEYGVSDEQAREVRLSCGGTVRILVEPAPRRSVLEALVRAQPLARVVELEGGATAVVGEVTADGELELNADTLVKVRALLRSGASAVVRQRGVALFVNTYVLPRRLIIVGAVHVAQILAPMAGAIGFEVVVIDPRPAFATQARLPGVTVIARRVEQVMGEMVLDARTAIVTLAHDPTLDDPALVAALASPVYYIGCLGSRKTHAGRLDRLRRAGFNEPVLERLHGPVGLDIGGRSAGEIAVSILAQLVAVGNGKTLSS